MKGTRHSEEQIIAILKQGEAGLATAELWAVSMAYCGADLLYGWKAKYGGAGASVT